MPRTKPLPKRSLEEVVAAFPAYRQSLLGNVDNCALSARFELEGKEFTTHPQARGILGHRIAAEILQTLRRTGETTLPTEEAMVIMREVCRQRDVPPDEVVILPARERRLLRICVLSLATETFNMHRLIDVEKRLSTIIAYDHPELGRVEREITGQPDALLADPPSGAVVLDWKFSLSAPPASDPAKPDDPHGDHQHVSYDGYWQQRFYALLVMKNYEAVQRVTLREYYPLVREARPATVSRDALEHVEEEISQVVEFLDRALMEGQKSKLWQPSPGKHCNFCRRPQSCPIEMSARAIQGGITSKTQARKLAGEYVTAKQASKVLHESLKGWVDQHEPIPVKSAKGRAELRWKTNKSGGRSFGLHVPDDSDRGPADPLLDKAFEEAAESAEA